MPKICLMCGATFPDATTFCPTDGSALRAVVQGDDLIGELVAERYLITDLISQGGMGEVYLASDVRLPQQFAIKVLREHTPDQTLIQRFRQEAEAVCRINHDRVARVYDFGFMADDRAYIVMEYVAGKTLRQVVEERGALDPVDAAKIILMAAEGIDAAHRLGIVHRDLKPENVMILDDPGGGTRVKVLDFGIAKLQNAEVSKGYTQPGFVIGTPAWMSPEQLLGEPLDARSDVYALGLVAFALLTGEHAFTGVSEQAEMMARVTVPPRTLTELRPEVQWPAELLRLFERTLSKNASDRPATAGQFAAAMLSAVPGNARAMAPASMTTALDGAPTSTKGSGATRAPRKNTQLMLGLGAAAVVMVVVGILWQQRGSGARSEVVASATEAPGPTVVQQPVSTPPAVDSEVAPPTPETGLPAAGAAAVATSSASTAAKKIIGAPSVDPRDRPVTVPSPVTTAPRDDKAAASTSAIGRNAELQRIMNEFDADDSAKKARETIVQIDVMFGRLRNTSDQAWAQMYLGKAHLTVGEKEKGCAAFERAATIGAAIELVRADSEQYRLFAGCRP